MNDFNDMVIAFDLQDLGYRFNKFTWSNNRNGSSYVAACLDRAFCNFKWTDFFVDPVLIHLPRLALDHSPILLQQKSPLSSSNIPFKFDAMWTHHPSFLQTVAHNWNLPSFGNPQFVLSQKLERLKMGMESWNKEVFGLLKTNILKAKP